MSPTPAARPRLLSVAALLVAVAVAYSSALRAGFVYDDLLLIERNPHIRDPANLPGALTSGFWDVVNPLASKEVGFYRPLVTALLMAGWQLSGPAPWGYHLLSVAFHAAASVLAYLLALRLARREGIAFAAAILFALHPIHTESVTWISGISDVSCGVFFFAALLIYFTGRDRGRPGWWVAPLAFLSLLLSLLGKEMALALLPLAIALDLARPASPDRAPAAARVRPLLRYAPFVVALAVYGALRIGAYGDWRGGFDRAQAHLGLSGPEAWRAWTLPVELFAGYVGKLLAPVHLTFFVVFRLDRRPFDLAILLPIAVGFLFLVALLRARRAGDAVLAGGGWFAIALLPALLRPEALGQFFFSERYAYIPSFGFCLALAALGARLLPRKPRWLPVGALLSVCAFYASRTHARNRDYADELSFFEAAREASPESATVRWSLGRVYAERAQREREPSRAASLWSAARAEFEASLAVDPGRFYVVKEDRIQANIGQGWTYLAEGSPGVAREIFRRVLERQREDGDRESAEAHMGLAAVAAIERDYDAAEREFGEAIRLNPQDERARFGLGVVVQDRGEIAKAAVAFQEALRLNPNHFGAAMRLGQALYHLGDRPGSIRAYERALEIDPRNPDAPLVREALEYLHRGG